MCAADVQPIGLKLAWKPRQRHGRGQRTPANTYSGRRQGGHCNPSISLRLSEGGVRTPRCLSAL